MDAALAPILRRVVLPGRGGLELAVREWPGDGSPFVLVHGLASNACTWDGVAPRLNEAGHHVIAVDQRGHGYSDKPDQGYGFDEVTADLHALIEALGLQRPVLAGQSWGGNVVLDFAARWPDVAFGIVLVDGGFIDLASAPGATWEKVSVDLRPPPLAGTPRVDLLQRMRSFHPDWSDEAIEMQMANFETLPDGTIRPWLSLDRHMLILRSIWEQRLSETYPRVSLPTLIAVAGSGSPDRLQRKQQEVAAAEAGLANASVTWFKDAPHDIHVAQPDALADWMLAALADRFFAQEANSSD